MFISWLRKEHAMKLAHLDFDQLKPCDLNVRKKGHAEIADLLPSVRALGILQPLLVRPNCEGFDIIAGRRRYNTVAALREEGITEPVPCIIMEDGDDAKAIESSLAENIARLPMDEIDQYKAFASLIEKGMSAEDIAAHFGVTERLVKQRLAIAGIIEPILNAYRRDEIDPATLRTLTMASTKQQKAWWKLFRSEDEYAPTGRALKDWLFGGAQIPTSNALFDVAEFKGAIVSDLFGDDAYFADSAAFWPLQNEAIARMREAYLTAGWGEVVILDIGQRFATWEHRKTRKAQGGKVFIAVAHNGEVTAHEGWLSAKEARRKEKAHETDDGEDASRITRSELTKPMQNYLGLHKHAAVRAGLVNDHGTALRFAVAHVIAGSALWSVKADDGRADNDAIAQSVSSGTATKEFREAAPAIRALLELEGTEAETIVPRRQDYGIGHDLEALFAVLVKKDDETVLRILAYVMAETLQTHTPMIDILGTMLKIDMRDVWQRDQVFFDLMRDKEAINAMVREVAGDMTADAHLTSTAKVQKKIIADCLSGDGRDKVEGWLPRYLEFPGRAYRSA